MNQFVAAFAICCILSVAQARPGHLDIGALALLAGGGGGGSGAGIDQYGGGGGGSSAPTNFQLVGVPDDESFASISFPEQQIQDLGTITEGELPPESIKVTKTITIKVPQPYPVDVPHPVPIPVSVPKPVPVPVTKLVHVPKPYPVEVTKTVPVPVEVPSHGYGSGLGSSGGGYDQHGGYSSNEAQVQDAPQQH